jgi:hypothetical protein
MATAVRAAIYGAFNLLTRAVTGFFERPILALITMVHSFSEEAKSRLYLRLGDVEREADDEFIEADRVGEKVREGLRLSWDEVTQKLEDIRDGWKSPGRKINLNFLN